MSLPTGNGPGGRCSVPGFGLNRRILMLGFQGSVCPNLLSLVRIENERKSATKGSRAGEGARPTLVLAELRNVKN